jgi:hypothetical protein
MSDIKNQENADLDECKCNICKRNIRDLGAFPLWSDKFEIICSHCCLLGALYKRGDILDKQLESIPKGIREEIKLIYKGEVINMEERHRIRMNKKERQARRLDLRKKFSEKAKETMQINLIWLNEDLCLEHINVNLGIKERYVLASNLRELQDIKSFLDEIIEVSEENDELCKL